jgi:membrane protease YdiL (CAAX protease family)
VSGWDRPTPFWRTARLLLGASRRRAQGRWEQNRRLMGHRGGDADVASLLAFLGYVAIGGVHACVAMLLVGSVDASRRLVADAAGLRQVSPSTLEQVDREEREATQGDPSRRPTAARTQEALRALFRKEARTDGARDDAQARGEELFEHYRRHGRAGLVARTTAWGFARTGTVDPLVALLGSLLIGAWFLTLVLQGEGVEFDLQRRRHPMWEWLLSHPVDPRAVFLAEMMSPLWVNPFVVMAPVFWIGAFWIAYDSPAIGLLAGLAVGVPIAIAATCATKTIEIVSFLTLPVRSRGAVLGILSWFGQATLMVMVFAAFTQGVLLAIARPLAGVSERLPAPLLAWSLGLSEGGASPLRGVLAGGLAAALIVAIAVHVSARATRHGLAGGFASTVETPRALVSTRHSSWLLRDPLHRKELLWLWRDRGALIQVFLVPLTLAAFQLLQFRSLLVAATRGWHLMAGASVLLGTYFLLTLGPRSLLSEGAALWLPLTWPRGLEDLLRAKARLWWLVSCIVVFPLLLVTAIRFPSAAAKVALVAVVWVAFAGSLAEKGVTLVTMVSASGEPEPVPRGRRFAASVGTLTFAIGVLSQRWTLACAGVVFSWMTSAALWQNFRARLPFLFDPWSERLPPPPTVLHGMVAISIAQEVLAVGTGIAVAVVGAQRQWFAISIAYGLAATSVGIGLTLWLARRGVRASAVWRWSEAPIGSRRALGGAVLGVAAGLALGAVGQVYVLLLDQLARWGWLSPMPMVASGAQRIGLAVVAVGLAPWGEEYLFRGLLFRSLEREWGLSRAVAGSACVFAIYHQPFAWIPVGLLGAASALLFKRTGHLAHSVLLHMAYNTVVVWLL